MAKDNAARQEEYRHRHLKHVDGQRERLNMVINL